MYGGGLVDEIKHLFVSGTTVYTRNVFDRDSFVDSRYIFPRHSLQFQLQSDLRAKSVEFLSRCGETQVAVVGQHFEWIGASSQRILLTGCRPQLFHTRSWNTRNEFL